MSNNSNTGEYYLLSLCHGETIHSKEGRYCGSLNPDLTPEGQEIANAFVLAYQSIPWETINVTLSCFGYRYQQIAEKA